MRLTALRRRVLELVWQSHKPLGAYDILAVLSEQDGRRAAPTVYRALDFLRKTAWSTASPRSTRSSAAITPNTPTRVSF